METNTLFAQKYEAFQKAINRQEAAWVPNAVQDTGGGLFWAGKTAYDVAGDRQAFAEAISSYMKDMWVDVSLLCALTTTARRDVAFPTAENRLAADGTITHLQVPHMEPEEYDQLIADPKGFIANVLLPRKYPYLFESREKTKELLKVYAEEQVGNLVLQGMVNAKYMAETYGVASVVNTGCMINTPLDHLFDYFRGFRGTLTDLRRQKGKIPAALDAIWQYRSAEQVAGPFDTSRGFAFQPCHIPAYLSPKQYKELYWPYEKKLIEWVASNGGKIYLLMEGHWEGIMDCFLDVPKDSLVLGVDDDDVLKVHEVLGDHQIIAGGIKMADARMKTFDQMKDDIKRVIDTCAPGGGFLLSTDKSFLTPGDVNPTVIECFNFAHEYSKK